jgi:hypothetical protein
LVKLAYFVHDLTDPAVLRRVRMFHAGGAQPVVLGFRRGEAAPESLDGALVVDLGRTYDARLGQRSVATARAALSTGRWRAALAGAQAVVARTLEMLAVASAARRACGLTAPLTYECLDIHRLMLGEGPKSRAARAIERALMRRADLLIVSSPAFLEAYFEPRQELGRRVKPAVLLVENKVLELGDRRPSLPAAPPAGPPWRIAWMGALRCRKSLEILSGLAERRPDLVQVSLHGRPSYVEFQDFDAQVRRLPNLAYRGPYTSEDLPRLYGQAHFAWSIDFMEEGRNSAWLLPNRVYEASRHGAVPIALAEVETGRFLADRGIGLLLSGPAALEARLEALSAADYLRLRAALEAAPPEAFVAGAAECRRLVQAVLAPGRPSPDTSVDLPRMAAI